MNPMPDPDPSRGAVLPYIVLVVGIPAATVVAGIVTMWLATHGADAIETEPVIKRGLAIEDPHHAAGAPRADGARSRDGGPTRDGRERP